VERLEKESIERTASSFAFFETDFDDGITDIFLEVLRQRQGKRLNELNLFSCPGNDNLVTVLQSIIALDLCSHVRLLGDRNRNLNYVQPTMDPFGYQIRLARNLSILSLGYLEFSHQDAISLKLGLDGNPHLEHLLLTDIKFQDGDHDASVQEIAQGLAGNNKLRVLSFTSCALTDHNLASLLRGVVSNPSLTTLRLFGNQCRDLSFNAIAQVLSSKNCKLTSLNMHQQFLSPRHQAQIREEGKFRIQTLNERWPATTVYRNKSLKHLVLAGNRLSDDDMQPLAMLVRRLASLESLDLDGNSITDAGVQLLADHATVPSRIRRLRLGGNLLSKQAQAAPALLKVLKQHPELHFVTPTIYWTVSKPLGDQIKDSLEQNRAGRVLLIAGQRKIALGMWPTVLARRNFVSAPFCGTKGLHNPNGIYYLLRNGPVLFNRHILSSEAWNKSQDRTTNKRKRELLYDDDKDPFKGMK
jgi:hypothetical protein